MPESKNLRIQFFHNFAPSIVITCQIKALLARINRKCANENASYLEIKSKQNGIKVVQKALKLQYYVCNFKTT